VPPCCKVMVLSRASPAVLAVMAKIAIFSVAPGAPVGLTVTLTGLVILPTEVTPMVVLTTVVVLDVALLVKVGVMVALEDAPRIVTFAVVAPAKPTVHVELEAAPKVKPLISALTVKFIYLLGPCGIGKLMLLKVTV